MQTTPENLRPAQDEVNRAAHNQDLIEVPKQAQLDRTLEAATYLLPSSKPEAQTKNDQQKQPPTAVVE
jgi:hypothetical protein